MNRCLCLLAVLASLVVAGTEAESLGAEPTRFHARHSTRYHLVPIETGLQERLTRPGADLFIAIDGSKPLDSLLKDPKFHADLREAAATQRSAFVFIFAPSRSVVHTHPRGTERSVERLVKDMGIPQVKAQWSTTTCNGEGIWERVNRLLSLDAELQAGFPEDPVQIAEIRLWPVQSPLSQLLIHDAKWFIETTGMRPLPSDYSAELAKALKDLGIQTTSVVRLEARRLSGQAQAGDIQVIDSWKEMIRSLGYRNAEVVY